MGEKPANMLYANAVLLMKTMQPHSDKGNQRQSGSMMRSNSFLNLILFKVTIRQGMLQNAAKLAPDDLAIRRQLGGLVALNLVHNRKNITEIYAE